MTAIDILKSRFVRKWLLSDILLVESSSIFAHLFGTATWADAKSNCKALGQHLAVLDSAEKTTAFLAQL